MADVELLASYWTIAGNSHPHSAIEYSLFDFKDRVVAASKAGFKGMGIKEGTTSPYCANVSGVNLHAEVCIPAHDRMKLERLCRLLKTKAGSTSCREVVSFKAFDQKGGSV